MIEDRRTDSELHLDLCDIMKNHAKFISDAYPPDLFVCIV